MKSSEIGTLQVHKEHHKSKSGKRAKDLKASNIEKNKTRGTNMKAFAIQNVKNARYKLERKAQIEYSTAKLPQNVRQGEIAPPDMIAVIGGNGVGKTTLVKALVKSYTGKSITDPQGPITVSVSSSKRITLFDVPNKLTAVLDIARVVDLVILVIDVERGIDTDIYEYLNIFQAIGFPKIFTVLTHEDKIENKYIKTRKQLRERIYKEIAAGAKIFDMPFLEFKDTYKREKVDVLSRCITQQKYSMPLEWKSQHGCVLVDRYEQKNDGSVNCFGFVRGTFLNKNQDFHIPGYADVQLSSMELQTDPALPDNKLILQKNKPILYAPMSEVGDIKIDDEAIHVKVNSAPKAGKAGKAMEIIKNIQIDDKLDKINLFGDDEASLEDLDPDLVANESINEELSDSSETFEEEEEEENENDWLGQEDDEDNDKHDDMSESKTDEQLDVDEDELLNQVKKNMELYPEMNEEDEEHEEEEIPTQKIDNEEERIKSYMRQMKLEKPQASKQYYHDLIYNYYKQQKVQKTQKAKKTGLLQLFDDDEEEAANYINVDLFPNKMVRNFTALPFQQRDSSKVFPINSVYSNSRLTYQKDFSKESLGKYFLEDTDYIEAVHKCLDGVTYEDVKPAQPIIKNKPANPLLNFQSTTDPFILQQEKELERLKQREQLLDKTLNTSRFAPGQYVKFTFTPIIEFKQNYDKHSPLILGGLLPQENQRQYITAKVKRHRWFPKILKTRNPLVFCIGWRRFQSLPYYSLKQETKTEMQYDSALQTESPPLKMLKYTPEHMHCQCTFYGYRVPAGSGVICFQDIQSKDFRICLNGTVQESSFELKLYKKLKLIGYCEELYKNTAFVGKMFNSKLEAAAFTGAGVRTVSGIRGIIKKPNDDNGQVRVTFEDKIRKNDTVFLKTYVKVKVDKFYNEWDNHCGKFVQIRQMAQIRQTSNAPIEYAADSQYKIEKKQIFVPQELALRPKFIQQLPFEEAQTYIKNKINHNNQSELELARKKIKDKNLKPLLAEETQEKRQKRVDELLKLNQQLVKEKIERKEKEATQKEKWNKGMTKKHDEEKQQELDEKRKKKRIVMQKLNEKNAKKGKL
ncbi:Ribosome_biogenesis protein BMS1 [Hexamita inflata]|uniref:Ribosome biogenesis protein BMS1 n=1 Tax=Hexamita inflata TaxID=28002 RepID=A0AA86VK57_9EUKA|nr:Ribosome biogenesis protein BMS1 [Hexamita inflata]